jgi:hypothetical protein
MAWITTKDGRHLNTDWFDKDRQIKQNQQQAEKLNKTPTMTDNDIKLVAKMKAEGFDERYNNDVIRSADKVRKYFPNIRQVRTVMPDNEMSASTVAGMIPAIGILQVNTKYINNYDKLVSDCERSHRTHYHPSDASIEHQIFDHEFAHLADGGLYDYLVSKTPDTTEEITAPTSEKAGKWIKSYSRAMGREVKPGETFQIPTSDYDKKFINIDGHMFSMNDFDGKQSMVSNLIVPMAFQNIRENWKDIGFAKEPEEDDLLDMLGGYATWSKYNDNNYLSECFAEAYAEYQSYGMDSSVPTLEIMRLTFALYESASKLPNNKTEEFYRILFAKED